MNYSSNKKRGKCTVVVYSCCITTGTLLVYVYDITHEIGKDRIFYALEDRILSIMDRILFVDDRILSSQDRLLYYLLHTEGKKCTIIDK